jgi:hypothetical protein
MQHLQVQGSCILMQKLALPDHTTACCKPVAEKEEFNCSAKFAEHLVPQHNAEL